MDSAAFPTRNRNRAELEDEAIFIQTPNPVLFCSSMYYYFNSLIMNNIFYLGEFFLMNLDVMNFHQVEIQLSDNRLNALYEISVFSQYYRWTKQAEMAIFTIK